MPPPRRPRVVDEPDAHALRRDDEPLGKLRAKLRLVDVSVDGGERGKASQPGENRAGGEVADVEDEVGPLENASALLRKAGEAVTEMRVADERDQGTPSRKRPSR